MSNRKEFWFPRIGESWYNAVPGLWESEYMNRVMLYLKGMYATGTMYPDKKDIFKAFKMTPFDDVKVVILGQDPYFDGSATGLAFANKDDSLRMSPSLEKIKECIEKENGMLHLDFDITLESWANQGVLLLNTALTVEKYKPNSHLDVWKKFTATILSTLTIKKDPIHFCLWGKKAQEYEQWLLTEAHYVHKFQHPAYAARQNIDWNCNHFKKINSQLKKKIQW